MNKIFAIIQREFITRVRKKSFIIMTILGPVLFAGIMVVPIWLATQDLGDQKIIQVIDNSGLFENPTWILKIRPESRFFPPKIPAWR